MRYASGTDRSHFLDFGRAITAASLKPRGYMPIAKQLWKSRVIRSPTANQPIQSAAAGILSRPGVVEETYRQHGRLFEFSLHSESLFRARLGCRLLLYQRNPHDGESNLYQFGFVHRRGDFTSHSGFLGRQTESFGVVCLFQQTRSFCQITCFIALSPATPPLLGLSSL